MRFVRCDACGAKASLAASQCPQCAVALVLRDSFGEPLPLSHCPTCDVYYPRGPSACRWCGTSAPTAQVAPIVWKGCAVVGGLVLVWVVWTRTTVGVQPPPQPATIVDSTLREPARAGSPPLPEVVAPEALAATTRLDTVTSEAPAQIASADSSPASVVAESVVAVPALPTRALLPELKAPRPPAPLRPAAAQRSVSRTRWVRATARDWVRLRAAAHPSSRTVALIGPDTRVQLGDSRKGWVRVTSSGISGWAESKQLFAVRR